MAQVSFRIFIPKPIASREDGLLFWRLFLRYFPRHVPTRLGNGVNPSADFDPNNLDVALKKWNRRDMSFQGNLLSLAGQVLRPRRSSPRRHTEIFVYAFEDDPEAVKNFLYEASGAFGADYATAHILTKEQERRKFQERVERAWLKSPGLGKKYEEQMQRHIEEWPKRAALGPELAAISDRRGCIVELNWLNILGPPYVKFFGRQRLLDTPAHEVRELPYGGINLEITDGLEDTAEAWDSFMIARALAKTHLNSNAFFDPNLPLTHIYNSPK
jgi:hypothetical protein